jgi:Flp pilus assembly pilin Flp
MRLVSKLRCLLVLENGQDLVEYALLLGVLAAGVTASTKSMAILITTALSQIAASFTAVVS